MRKSKREANTLLARLFSRGLADERYEVKRYRTDARGGIRPVAAGEPGKHGRKRVMASRRDRARAGEHASPQEALTPVNEMRQGLAGFVEPLQGDLDRRAAAVTLPAYVSR